MAPMRTSRRRSLRLWTGAALALLALRTFSFVAPRGPLATGPLTRRHAAETAELTKEEAPTDDGRVLDGSGIVGSVGAVVLAVALLPYVALSIYSAVQLATQGQAVAPVAVGGTLAPTGVLGLGEGIGVFVVFGVSVWSALSLVLRGSGLPEGPIGLLGLTQSLSFVSALFFALAAFLNGLGEENPVRGISLGASPAQLEQVASKSSKLLNKSAEEVARLTAEPRAGLEAKLQEVQEQASTELSKSNVKLPELPDVKAPDIKLPDVKVPDVKVPDFKMPDFKLPNVKVPDMKLPDVKMPAFKAPELKLPSAKAPLAEEPEEEDEPTKVEAPKAKQAEPSKQDVDLFG